MSRRSAILLILVISLLAGISPARGAAADHRHRGNPLTVSEGGETVTRTYDERGRVESRTDVHGNTFGFRYDANSNLTRITYPGGVKSVDYEYDSHDRLEAVIDWEDRVTRYDYDLNGRLTGIRHANGTSTRYVYVCGVGPVRMWGRSRESRKALGQGGCLSGTESGRERR